MSKTFDPSIDPYVYEHLSIGERASLLQEMSKLPVHTSVKDGVEHYQFGWFTIVAFFTQALAFAGGIDVGRKAQYEELSMKPDGFIYDGAGQRMSEEAVRATLASKGP